MDIIDRFKMQDQSARVMSQYEPGSNPPRQSLCLRALRSEASTIDLKKNLGSKKAHYTSLQTCGSVWTCPVCASKISEVRKNEIDELLCKTDGKTHIFITYTLPHYKGQSCSEVRKKLMSSRRKMKAFKSLKSDTSFIPYKKLMNHYHIDGSVTTIDVTYGRNGWHVHAHELLIFEDKIPENEEKRFHGILFQNWKKAIILNNVDIKNGEAFRRRAVVTEFCKGNISHRYSSYISKIEKSHDVENAWGIAAELSKGHLKLADFENQKKGSVPDNITPFGMLAAMAQDRNMYSQFSHIFYEYSQAMKGGRFIFFSKDLKRKYGISEIKDEDIMQVKDVLAEFYGFFEVSEWNQIKKNKLRGWIIQNSELSFEELQTDLSKKIKEMENGK